MLAAVLACLILPIIGLLAWDQGFLVVRKPSARKLAINSEPAGATLAINGTLVNKLTNTEVSILPGKYTIVVSKEGYGTITRKFEVPAEGKAAPLTFQLEAVEKVAQAGTVEASAPMPVRRMMRIASVPSGARIVLDGKPLEATTDIELELEIGAHLLRLEKDGFHPTERSFRIEGAGEAPALSVTLDPMAGSTPSEEDESSREEETADARGPKLPQGMVAVGTARRRVGVAAQSVL